MGGRHRILRFVGPTVGLALFAAAIGVLHHQLRSYHLPQILDALRAIPRSRILLAAAAAAASYLAASCYDALAMRSIGKRLGWPRVAAASFIATSLSNSMGFGLLTGGSVRYRFYSSWDVSMSEIARVLLFFSVTLWLGFFALAGAVFTFEPLALPSALRLPFASARPLGVLLLALAAAYLLLTVAVRKPLQLGTIQLALPPARYYPAQLAVSVLDWAAAAATLYVLLPAGMGLSFAAFLGVYLLALIAGMVSQVPGGLGVFETSLLLLLAGRVQPPQLLGSLALYRVVYYLAPLALAALSLGAHELLQRRESVARAARFFNRWSAAIAPPFLSFAVLLAGAVLLVSGATPAAQERMRFLARLVPLSVIEGSHFLGSVAGVGLLLLSRGLQRRVDAAWVATAGLLTAGITLSLLKGFDYEEAMVLGVVLAALLPARRHFYRVSSLSSPSLSPAWIAAALAVVAGTVWLTLFSHKHVAVSQDLWWQFALHGDAPRSLRALTGAVVLLVGAAFWTLLRPGPGREAAPEPVDMETVDRLVRACPRSLASLALLGDKRFLFSRAQDAFVMYGVASGVYASMGDPVGPEERWRDLAWDLRQLADRYGAGVAFYEVDAASLPLYLDLGLTAVKIGEEARVSLADFSLEGGSRKGLRYAVNRLDRDGCSFEVVPRGQSAAILDQLEPVSDAWLAGKRAKEKGFSLGSFRRDYLARLPVGVARRDGRVLAFVTIWAGDNREEASVDLMRHPPDAPNGIMDYLFAKVMLWARDEGYRWFNLGMAPFAGLEEHPLAPFWSRAGAFVYRHGEHFYNFQGLRQYKEKFAPVLDFQVPRQPGRALARAGAHRAGDAVVGRPGRAGLQVAPAGAAKGRRAGMSRVDRLCCTPRGGWRCASR